MHTRRSQTGIASVEAILLIPFMLLLIALIISNSRFASHIIHNTIDARTSAWRGALFNHCETAMEPRFGGAYLGSDCTTSDQNANIYLSSLARSSQAAMFTAILRHSDIPESTTATATSDFRPFLIDDSYRVLISDQHSLDAMPAWEREQMPNGYNRVLLRF